MRVSILTETVTIIHKRMVLQSCDLDLSSRSRKLMSLDVAYCIVPWYQVLGMMSDGFNTLRNITICLFHVTFDLHLWPFAFVKVTCTLIITCILCCWMSVPKMKFVGSIEFKTWTFVWRKLKWRHNDVITHSIFMKF